MRHLKRRCRNAPPFLLSAETSSGAPYNLNTKPLVILNLFQDNQPTLNIILKQVQDDD